MFITPSLTLSSSPPCGSHGTIAVAHQVLPFVTGTDGASVHEHIISREVQGRCAGGRTIQTNTHFLGISCNRAATVTTTAAVQQQYNSTSASNSGLCDSHGASVFMYVCGVHTEIFIHALNHDHFYFHGPVQF